MRTQLQAFIARRVENTQAAEDLTQEVLLRLVRSNPDELADPAAWLYRVARNVIIDHYRTRRPDPARVEASELSNSVDPFADDPSLARQELAHCLRSLINQLDEPYQIRDHRRGPRRENPRLRRRPDRAERPWHEIPRATRPPAAASLTHRLLRRPNLRRRNGDRLHRSTILHSRHRLHRLKRRPPTDAPATATSIARTATKCPISAMEDRHARSAPSGKSTRVGERRRAGGDHGGTRRASHSHPRALLSEEFAPLTRQCAPRDHYQLIRYHRRDTPEAA